MCEDHIKGECQQRHTGKWFKREESDSRPPLKGFSSHLILATPRPRELFQVRTKTSFAPFSFTSCSQTFTEHTSHLKKLKFLRQGHTERLTMLIAPSTVICGHCLISLLLGCCTEAEPQLSFYKNYLVTLEWDW